MKEEECLFLYAGATFLKERITIKRWVNFEGNCVTLLIISLDQDIDAKWNAFRRKIMKDKPFDNDEMSGFFSTFVSENSHTFSSQNLQQITKLWLMQKFTMYVLIHMTIKFLRIIFLMMGLCPGVPRSLMRTSGPSDWCTL